MKQLKTYDVLFTAQIVTYDYIDVERLLKLLEQQLEECSNDCAIGRYLVNCSSLGLKERTND